MESYKKVIEKVHSILKSLDILASHYDDELNELQDTILELCESLRWSMRKVTNLDDDLSSCKFTSEERRLKIEML